jgi:excisionase family DNA binding protein
MADPSEMLDPRLVVGAEYLRRREVAKKLRVSVRLVERWARNGFGPPFVMIGRIPLYPADELDAWLRSRLARSTAPSKAAA